MGGRANAGGARERRKAPPGCYWRGRILYGRIEIRGEEFRWSLRTGNAAIAAQRRKAEADKLVGGAHYGEHHKTYQEAVSAWAGWIADQVAASTAKRYAVSLRQLEPALLSLPLADIDGAKLSELISSRKAGGASVATIRRDLTALSSVLGYCETEGWRDDNPALNWLRRMRERRDPITLPLEASIAAVLDRAPAMFAELVRAAELTGCRLSELTGARRQHLDHARRQLTVIGKGNKLRTIDLEPFGAYALIAALPAYVGSPFLFWHDAGEPYRNASSRFRGFVREIAADDKNFVPFRFHDLRHLHAVQWLKSGRNIYDLQIRLGHSSLKTTELYLKFLTAEERRLTMFGQHTGALAAS